MLGIIFATIPQQLRFVASNYKIRTFFDSLTIVFTMTRTLYASFGISMPLFIIFYLARFIIKLLSDQFLPNEIQIGFPFVFLEVFDIYGNIANVWHPWYLICDFLLFWMTITLVIVVFSLLKKNN